MRLAFGVVVLLTLGGVSGQEEEWRPEKLSDSVLESTLVRYYVFGMRNPEEFENGETPEMFELGPFTYREKRVKQNFKRVAESQLEYDVHWSMHFLPELTGEGLDEDTEFTTVNVPYVTMAEGLSIVGLPKAFNDLLMDEVTEGGEGIVREGLSFGDSTFYGYNISLYTTILDDVTQGQTEERYPELANGRFAFFKDKNNTVTGNYTVVSTREAPFGGILSFNGMSNLGMWGEGTTCDDVTGALDFFTVKGNIKKNKEVEIFLPENCRKMRMKMVGEEEFRGVNVTVWKFPLEQFQNQIGEGRDGCYCLNFRNISDPKCFDEGFLDYSGCSKGAPLLGSFPHFLNANPRHLANVKGLMPNKSLHESEVMIEPITGTVLYAVRRFQLNLLMHPLPTVTQFENITERIVPLAWFEHILEVPSSVFTEVKEKLEKLSREKEMYKHEEEGVYKDGNESGMEEVSDNTLFSERSGFPANSQDEESAPTGVPEAANTAGSTIRINLVFAVMVVVVVMLMENESRTSYLV